MSGHESPTADTVSLIGRRRRVGATAIGCLLLAAAGLVAGQKDSAWPAACLRIGIVLGAIWLCLPTTRRASIWNKLSRRRLAVIVLVAVFFNRLKVLIPMLAAIGIAAWIVRPKKRR